MKTLEAKSKKYLSSDVGLQGLDRDINRARLDAGKGVAFLANAMASHYQTHSDLMAAIDDRLKLQKGAAHAYHLIDTAYVNPPFQNGMAFTYKFLCGTPYLNLIAFAPYLMKYYTVPNFALADKIWLTPWSVEVALARHNNAIQWWDLRELAVSEIKNLDLSMSQQVVERDGATGDLPTLEEASSAAQVAYPSHSEAEEVALLPAPTAQQDPGVLVEAGMFGPEDLLGDLDTFDFGNAF